MSENVPNQFNLISDYLEKAVLQAGGTSLNEEQKNVIKAELTAGLEQRLRLTSLEALDEAGLVEWSKLVEEGKTDLESQVKFFIDHIPGYEAMIKQELAKAVEEFVTISKTI